MEPRRFLLLLRPHAGGLALAGALLAVGAPVPAASVWLLTSVLDRLATGDGAGLVAACGALALVLVGGHAATLLRGAATRRVAWAVASDLRRRLHAALLARPAEGAMGDRLSALLDEADQVQYGVNALVGLAKNPVQLALVLGTAAALAPELVAPAAVLLLPAGLVAGLGGRRVRSATAASRRARAAMATLATEQLGAVDVLRAFGAEPGERVRFEAADERDRRARWRLEVERGWPSVAVSALLAAALCALVALGGARISAGTLDPPALVAFVAALVLAQRPLADLAEAWGLAQRASAALERVDRVIADHVAHDVPRTVPHGPLRVSWAAVSVVRGRAIVDDVALEAEPGEILALVGPTGAGKTTLLRLALGAVPPDAGTVTVGGVAPARLPPGRVAIVPQDAALLARTVAENVALGAEPADRDRALRALEAAGAGFADPDDLLDEGGRGLSGGERQRLCLARALYRDAPVLLLDEPTGQLDADTARGIVATLRELRPGRTIVVATHDPEVWARADRVAVLRDGRLVAVGDPSAVRGAAWTASSAS